MHFVGEATDMGASLELAAPSGEWRVSIRRVDWKSDPAFLALNAAPVSAADVSFFLPDWADCVWKSVEESMFSLGKSRAKGPDYQVTIFAAPGSPLRTTDVLAAFLDFMSNGAH
jgi:hypothetical protein